MQPVKKKQGFTLVELSLSLVFIAILSLTVAYIINDTISSYRKGVTLKQLNTIGSSLVDDMRAAIQNSSSKSVKNNCAVVYGDIYKEGGSDAGTRCENDGGKGLVMVVTKTNVNGKNGKAALANVPVFGAFCTGEYSYSWNSGYFFNGEDRGYVVEGVNRASIRFKTDGTIKSNNVCTKNAGSTMTCSGFKLLKILDKSRSVCASAVGSNYNTSAIDPAFNTISIGEAISEEPIDLLATDGVEDGLALYDLYVTAPAESAARNKLFYSVTFVLGTIQGGINVTATGGACATPDDYATENFDYCAINKFNFAAQATGG